MKKGKENQSMDKIYTVDVSNCFSTLCPLKFFVIYLKKFSTGSVEKPVENLCFAILNHYFQTTFSILHI
jgi:hypothetical protein